MTQEVTHVRLHLRRVGPYGLPVLRPLTTSGLGSGDKGPGGFRSVRERDTRGRVLSVVGVVRTRQSPLGTGPR